MLGLRCCAWAFSSCSERGLLFIAVCTLLIAVACCGARALGTWASVVVPHRLSSCGSWALERRLSSYGAQAYLLCSMWDLPRPRIKPVSPVLAGGFLTTAPPRKPEFFILSYPAERSHMLIHEHTHIHHHIVDFIVYTFFLDSFPKFCNIIINFPQGIIPPTASPYNVGKAKSTPRSRGKHVTWVCTNHCLAHP